MPPVLQKTMLFTLTFAPRLHRFALADTNKKAGRLDRLQNDRVM